MVEWEERGVAVLLMGSVGVEGRRWQRKCQHSNGAAGMTTMRSRDSKSVGVLMTIRLWSGPRRRCTCCSLPSPPLGGRWLGRGFDSAGAAVARSFADAQSKRHPLLAAATSWRRECLPPRPRGCRRWPANPPLLRPRSTHAPQQVFCFVFFACIKVQKYKKREGCVVDAAAAAMEEEDENCC